MKKQRKKQPSEPTIFSKLVPTLTRIVWEVLTHFDKIQDFFN